MANIIRIRTLELEKNLNNLLIPVDKDGYGTKNARKITILDLKSWILSGFTGNNINTSCTGITSNIIKVIVTGTTTTTTTTSTSTTTTTVSPLTSQIYFNNIANGALAVNNSLGRTFTINFKYEIYAFCDNAGSFGADPNNATTIFSISTNGGISFTTVATVNASVPGGDISSQYSTQPPISGITSINNISNVANVIMGGSTECSFINNNTKDGYIKITLLSVTANSGVVTIICNDKWQKTCFLGVSTNSVSCTSSFTTTTTTTILNQIYLNNLSPTVNARTFTLDGVAINGASSHLIGISSTSGTTTQQGSLTISLVIYNYTGYNNITIVDSNSNVHCQDIIATDTYYFNNISVNSNNPVYLNIDQGSCF